MVHSEITGAAVADGDVFPGRKFHGALSFIKQTCIIADERYDHEAFMRMLESIK